ncbi:hypothetical protein Nepgr_025298 [Nepenthes gracilis]|uniref:NAD-dependent epimerase/dehydratase domain-containing protein n=1 Tax=Nepenthes gracilis TaxID=150966 RepID=A0AAD3T5K6_NEPGR|nr:hypothetical protein Nepgr_025298 [Nepenthes gracilis]
MTVLVTGAAGFVGTHVSAALKQRRDGVLGFDNFNDYYNLSLKQARESLLEHSGVLIVEGNINDKLLLTKLFEIVSFTHVMHLAAQASVLHSNIIGFVSLLEFCKSANPQPSIVWASSNSVYGLNTKMPFSENDRADQPASLCAATKKAGEEIAHIYNHMYGLSLHCSAVLHWTYQKGKSIPFFDSQKLGTVARDFTYVDDTVKGCLSALDIAGKSTGINGKKTGKAPLRVFNLGNTLPVKVSDLVSILERILKVKAKMTVMKLPGNGDVEYTHASISLAERELSYKTTTDLQIGLKKFVKWYLSYYKSRKKGAE